MSAIEFRASDEVATWLAAGLALRRVPGDADGAIAAAIIACAAELATLPPAGVVADLAMLLGGARMSAEPPALRDDQLRAALHAYDDDVLARLVGAPRFEDAVAAFAHLSPRLRADAVALVLGAMLDRIGYTGIAISAAALRRALARGLPPTTLNAAAEAQAGEYLRLARAARQTRTLVEEREVFALDHLDVLGTFSRRLGARQIALAADAFTAALPRRLAVRRDRGLAATHLPDADTYPAGGYAAITPGGAEANLENLVTSELAYMEPAHRDVDPPALPFGSASGRAHAPLDPPALPFDLFTVRYVESELLFYARDDSVFRRLRQCIVLVLPPDLEQSRVKDPALPWQRLTLLLGAVIALVRWLATRLGERALSIHVVVPAPLPERDLLSLLLSDERERGLVSIVDVPPDVAATDVIPLVVPGATWEDWVASVESVLRSLV